MDFEFLLNENKENKAPKSLQDLTLGLKQAIIQELNIQEVLPYETALVNRSMSKLESQIKKVEDLKVTEDNKFISNIMQLDVIRNKYLLKKYLRIRLSKLESNVYYVIKNELVHLLSEAEVEYTKRYVSEIIEASSRR